MKTITCKLALSAGFLLVHLPNMVASHVPTSSTGRRRLGNDAGTIADAKDDDFSNLAMSTSITSFENTTTTNITSSNSTNAAENYSSNETTPEVEEEPPTETPTLTVEELISLMDDDSIQNVTNFIPGEKEQPKGWAVEVIGFFLLSAVVLFAATGIKQCRKRRTYSEVPTSLVV